MNEEIKHNIIESELESYTGRQTSRTNSTEQPLENNQNFQRIKNNNLIIENRDLILNKNNNIVNGKISNKMNNSTFSNYSNNLTTILNTSNLSSNRYYKEKKKKK